MTKLTVHAKSSEGRQARDNSASKGSIGSRIKEHARNGQLKTPKISPQPTVKKRAAKKVPKAAKSTRQKKMVSR